MPSKKVTNQDILEAVNEFSQHVEGRFQRLENDVTEIKGEIVVMKNDIAGIKGEIVGIKGDMDGVVTKDFLLDALGNYRADLKSEDRMIVTLTDTLAEKKVLSKNEHVRIVNLSPFKKR